MDETANDEQVARLLDVFEDRLESVPAEVISRLSIRRAVYRASMHYIPGENQPTLHIDFTPDQQPWRKAQVLQGISGLDEQPIRAWSYHGPMVLRETFDLNKG